MFDLPSMLGEYLLPLIIVVPLALVVLLIASRSGRDEAKRPPPPAWTPPRVPPSTMTQPRQPGEAPQGRAAASVAATDAAAAVTPFAEPVSPWAYAATEPMPLQAETPRPAPAVFAPTEPMPLMPEVAPPAAAAPAAPAAGTPLLVVDDSAVVRAKLSKLLAGAGYSVTLARHGAEALELVNQHWYAVMITDLEMPEMDGFELIGHVSNDLRTESLPIIAITGHEALQAKVQDAKGLFGIFKKPWNDRELLARVAVLTQLRPRS